MSAVQEQLSASFAGRYRIEREFATDGARFYFTIAQDESDVWVVEIR